MKRKMTKEKEDGVREEGYFFKKGGKVSHWMAPFPLVLSVRSNSELWGNSNTVSKWIIKLIIA